MNHDFKLVLATGNDHKLHELFAILEPQLPGLRLDQIATSRDFDVEEPVEDQTTFRGNALVKARAYAKHTGLPAVADDSGLAVDILGGAPGIFSARWCGRHGDDAANLELLLNQLADVPQQYRGAKFACAAAFVEPDGFETVEYAEMRGRLLTSPRGEGGFGYDPIFRPEGYELTTAELSPAEKNAISHRGQAFRKLADTIVHRLNVAPT